MRKPRISLPNALYHIYNQGVNRLEIFQERADNLFWINLLKIAKDKYDIHVYCFVTMKNHFHCVIETVESNISKVLWHLGYYYAKYFNAKYGRVGHLYRNRCKTQLITDVKYLQTVVWYVHNNPVAAGLISNVNEYRKDILTSYHDLSHQSNNYPWLSNYRLREKLEMEIPGYSDHMKMSESIDKQDFMDLTKMEILNQRMSRLI